LKASLGALDDFPLVENLGDFEFFAPRFPGNQENEVKKI